MSIRQKLPFWLAIQCLALMLIVPQVVKADDACTSAGYCVRALDGYVFLPSRLMPDAAADAAGRSLPISEVPRLHS